MQRPQNSRILQCRNIGTAITPSIASVLQNFCCRQRKDKNNNGGGKVLTIFDIPSRGVRHPFYTAKHH